MIRLAALAERLRQRLWFIPAVFAIVAAVAAFILLAVDREIEAGGGPVVFGGTPDGAREVLSTIAQSMLTFTGLVFTITMLVLQLASSQLSPRVMRTFLRDRGNQVVLGLFVATFLFTLLILRDVRSEDAGEEFVPGLSIWTAFVLLVASIAAFIYYIDHMAQAIRASTVIHEVGEETRGALDRLYPEGLGRDPQEPTTPAAARPTRDPLSTIESEKPGNLVAVDEDGLFERATDADVLIEVIPAPGTFVPEGAPIARIWPGTAEGGADGGHGRDPDDLEKAVHRALTLERERTLQQDAAFGLRQLVDIAVRALSPGINDPTTATQAIDQLHDLLRRLARRAIPSPVRLDDAGRVRLILDRPDWDTYVRLAVDEIRLAGRSSLQIVRRLRAMLLDLETVASPTRRTVLRLELAALDADLERSFDDPRDAELARNPSRTGNG